MEELDQLDLAPQWTFVDTQSFNSMGSVEEVMFFAGAGTAGRELRVGLYRPRGTAGCEFTLVEQRTLSGITEGINRVRFCA